MINWLNKIISGLKAKKITQRKLEEAYLLKDAKYLRNAYRDGRDYVKIQAVEYLGEIPIQDNFDFLVAEIKRLKDVRLKSFVYASIMNIVLNEQIKISDSESEYLHQNLDLLDNIEYINYEPKELKSEPISFRHNLKDHLELLEEKIRQNRIDY